MFREGETDVRVFGGEVAVAGVREVGPEEGVVNVVEGGGEGR